MSSPEVQGTVDRGDRPRRRRPWRWVGLSLVAVLVTAVVVFGLEAWRAYHALRQARSDVTTLQAEVTRGDLPAARRTAEQLSGHAGSARRASDGWLWDAGSRLPFLGSDVESVQVVARSLDDLAGEPVRDSLVLLSRLQSGTFVPDGRRLDLAEYARTVPLVSRISRHVGTARADVDELRPDDLIGPLGRVVSRFQAQLATADGAARASRTAMTLVPAMMGATGPRSILLVVQNNAEIRSTAGLPGSFSFIEARAGKLVMGPHYSTSDLKPLARPTAALTADERGLFGPTPATDVRDTNLMPDFPRAAQLLSAIVGKETGRKVDAVVSVDPVTLSRVLRATGPIKVGPETFTSQNVVAKLLHEPYQRFDSQSGQNAYFSTAAQAITATMLEGRGDARGLIRQLTQSVGQRRVTVWSSRPDEQKLLDGTAIAGALPRSVHGAPHVGMYLNDAAGGKLEYYLRTQGSIESLGCSASRTTGQSVRATFQMRSLVPAGAHGLSRWVTGFAPESRRGLMKLKLRIYAPAGGRLTGLDVDGARVAVGQGQQDGRSVSILPVSLRPGQRVEVAATFDAPHSASGDPVLDWTPSIVWQSPSATAASTC